MKQIGLCQLSRLRAFWGAGEGHEMVCSTPDLGFGFHVGHALGSMFYVVQLGAGSGVSWGITGQTVFPILKECAKEDMECPQL